MEMAGKSEMFILLTMVILGDILNGLMNKDSLANRK